MGISAEKIGSGKDGEMWMADGRENLAFVCHLGVAPDSLAVA